MLKQLSLSVLFVFAAFISSKGQLSDSAQVAQFKSDLEEWISVEPEPFLKLSFQSILNVINSKPSLSNSDLNHLAEMSVYFYEEDSGISARSMQSYLLRKQSLIIAWESASDGEISYTWLELPKDWDAKKTYPLYMQLHGYWDVAGDKIQYMAYPYYTGPSSVDAYAFEDGYHVSPWGRGNLWYEGISEIDFWECVEVVNDLFEIDISRRYLCGHSMGGYGAWNLGQKSNEYWAALGIHAGALWWGSTDMLSVEVIDNLSEMPVYFVCGTSDGLININRQAYGLLQDVGNKNLAFETFDGGHEYRGVDVEGMYDWMRVFSKEITTVKDFYTNNSKISIGPNPFVEQIELKLSLVGNQTVTFELYNMQGQLVELLFERNLSAGEYEMTWELPILKAGVYTCRIQMGNFSVSKRLLKY